MTDRTRDIFLGNAGTKFVSIVIAVVLWAIVLGSRSVTLNKEVPLEVITSSDVVPANDLPRTVVMELSGPKAYLRTFVESQEPFRLNLAGRKPGVITQHIFADDIQVPIGVKVVSVHPAEVVVKLESLKRRDVPVKPEIRGVPADGYKVGKVTVRPSLVRIKGAESRVEATTEVKTLPIDVTNAKQSLERDAALDLQSLGVQLDGPLPKAFVEVTASSPNFRIKNIDIQYLTSYKVRTEDRTVTVLVRADPKDIKLLDKGHVYAQVDLKGKPKGTYTENVRVTLPEDVGLVKIIPEKVRVTLY